MIKLALIAVFTIIVCLSYFPVLPILTFLIFFIGTWIAGGISADEMMKRLFLFVAVSIAFMLSMLLLRGFDEDAVIIVRFLIFKWTESDIVHAVSLGFRILALVTMSMSFVLTTKPSKLVLSLIMQCKVSDVHGYAAMAAYRFLPELQSHVDAIHLAQEIRGIPWNKGVFSRLSSPFRVLLPLLCVAARRGERIACAMESRGMGRDNPRTYYERCKIDTADWLFFVGMLIAYILIVAVLAKCDLYKLNFASIL